MTSTTTQPQVRAQEARPSASPAVAVHGVHKAFRLPHQQYHTLKERALHPFRGSTFDVLQWCKPVFGPASRSLPQLPLGVNAAGELIAQGDFTEPVGPAYWNRE